MGKENAAHLINALMEKYEVSTDWTGGLYCSIKLDWNYTHRYIDTSMPGYVLTNLRKFGHKKPKQPQHTHCLPAPRRYGQDTQKLEPPNKTPVLNKPEQKIIQRITGTFLLW